MKDANQSSNKLPPHLRISNASASGLYTPSLLLFSLPPIPIESSLVGHHFSDGSALFVLQDTLGFQSSSRLLESPGLYSVEVYVSNLFILFILLISLHISISIFISISISPAFSPEKENGQKNSRSIRLIDIAHDAEQQASKKAIHPDILPSFLGRLLARRHAKQPSGRRVVVGRVIAR
jgi:hypothetical protein